ncbi:MAG: sensor histidine kinase, partial [Actinomycetia bacterium]|nr:sensor histidine kinase [Actinomycetes bacterium]
PLGSELATQTLEELAFSSIFTIIICAVIVYLVGRLRSRTEDLLEANRSITSYAARVETAAAVEERHRLARELHDTLAHSLSALTIQLGAIDARWDSDPIEARHQLNEAEQNARVGLSEARRAMQALTASPLEDLGLHRAVTGEIERSVDKSCVTTIEWGQLPDLDSTTELQVYRIIQEAVRNCSRHAHATTLNLTVRPIGTNLCVTVHDNGIGFDATQTDPDRGGLRSMGERATTLGGKLTIESQPGTGTTVQATIPIGTEP